MQALLSGDTSATESAFFRELFLQRLPSKVRMVVASSTDSDVQHKQICVGITSALVMQPRSAKFHALRRETSKPVTDGDFRGWREALFYSPFLYN